MEKIFEFARNFRLVLFIIAIVAVCATTRGFWPPDLVPHPHIPDPNDEKPQYPDDHIS